MDSPDIYYSPLGDPALIERESFLRDRNDHECVARHFAAVVAANKLPTVDDVALARWYLSGRAPMCSILRRIPAAAATGE